jgi:hypothetical protein
MASSPDDNAKSEIDALDAPTIEQLPFEYVTKPSNRTTRLLANATDQSALVGQNRWYDYKFKEPVFIQSIVINHKNYSSLENFSLQIIGIDGQISDKKAKIDGGKTALIVNSLCKEIKFRPPKEYLFKNKSISSVYIFGFDLKKAGEFIAFARNIEDLQEGAVARIEHREEIYRRKIAEAELAVKNVAEATKELQSLKGQTQRQRTANQTLNSQKDELTQKINALEIAVATNNREYNNLISSLSIKSKEKLKIEAEISKLESRLSELRANINLFPTELEKFVEQGSQNTKTLFLLSAIPILIILSMFCLLISGAVDLTTKIDPEGKINVAALVASRAPYVVVALAIITSCYKICKFFMLELIEINRQRLNLTKIGIIAKDVSNSAEYGLDLSEVEKYGLRVRFKMELLKDHLKGYVSPNLDIKLPSDLSNFHPFSELLRDEENDKGAQKRDSIAEKADER